MSSIRDDPRYTSTTGEPSIADLRFDLALALTDAAVLSRSSENCYAHAHAVHTAHGALALLGKPDYAAAVSATVSAVSGQSTRQTADSLLLLLASGPGSASNHAQELKSAFWSRLAIGQLHAAEGRWAETRAWLTSGGKEAMLAFVDARVSAADSEAGTSDLEKIRKLLEANFASKDLVEAEQSRATDDARDSREDYHLVERDELEGDTLDELDDKWHLVYPSSE
ncbi:hypothetical protein Q5752_005836 [Cryptotrichosporon argae]